MSSFASSGSVFVLGAGASAFAGYPIAADLFPFIRNLQSLDQTTQELASRVLEKFGQAETQFAKTVVFQPNGNPILEQVLTYLEIYKSFPKMAFDWAPWTSDDTHSIRRVVSERFLRYQEDLQEGAWGCGTTSGSVLSDMNHVREVAHAWSRLLKAGDVIVSFNWDVLHEAILEREGVWAPADGYGFDIPVELKMHQETKVLLLKLHGSVNWIQENDLSPVTGLVNTKNLGAYKQSGAGNSERPVHLVPRLVLPTYLKDVSSNPTLLDIWTQARRFITKAPEMFVIGYSMNPVDHPARLLFGIALSENSRLKRVTVVSPDAATQWAEFLPRVHKEFVHSPRKFEDWVVAESRHSN